MHAVSKDDAGEEKKKRKRTIKVEGPSEGPSGDSKVDVKRIRSDKQPANLFYAEEAEVETRDVDEDCSLFATTCEDIQKIIKDVWRLKDENRKEASPKPKDEIEKCRVDGSLQFLVLKKLNRLAHIRCKKVRDETNECKQTIGKYHLQLQNLLYEVMHLEKEITKCENGLIRHLYRRPTYMENHLKRHQIIWKITLEKCKQTIDKYHLQLQNLLYEVMHLEKEITKCLEFKSKDEEIDLVPVEKFYEEAPAEISKPEVTKKDLHQQTLARLDWELEQRKQLAAKLKEAQDKKEKIEDDIKTKQDYLDNLQPKLNTILQSTKPVQDYLKMPFDDIREEHQTASYLPQPLFVLYMQTNAYKDACDKRLSVSLEGDVNAAKSFDLSSQVIDEESDSDQDEQEQEEREETEKKSSKRRRKTVEVRTSEKNKRVFRKHPISVVNTVSCKDGSSLVLRFSYLTYLHIITVTVVVKISSDSSTNCVSGGDLLSPDLILSDLYPGDHGNTSPNLSNQYELNRFGLKDFNHYIGQLGRPYIWAQWMGGLQFINGEGQKRCLSSVSSGNMQLTMKKIHRRIKSRLSLLKQLNSLEHHTIPVASEYQNLFPAKLSSQLVSWQRSTYEDYVAAPYTKRIVDLELAHETDLYFVAGLERGTAKLTARIVVAPDYPTVAPVFAVSVKWQSDRSALNDFHIQQMEEEVNIHYEELTKDKSRDQLLTNQLQRLAMCFDVYLETETVNTAREGPSEISREKVFTRVARGPQRSKPYKFCPDIGIFTHR